MNEAPPPHPLDADDDDDSRIAARRYRPATPPLAYRPLLRPSLVVATVSVLTLFASSALSVITPLASVANNAALVVFRLSGVVLILALGGVLMAYRIGQLERNQLRLPQFRRPRIAGYGTFAVANALALPGLWLVLILLGWAFGGVIAVITGPLLMILAGLLATMIVWHRGYLRAFAIGGFTALLIGTLPMLLWSAAVLFDGGFSSGRVVRGPVNFVVISTGITLTIAQISGLVSAGYVVALESWRRLQSTDDRCH